MTMMFHNEKHSPENQLKCNKENQKTFVDNNSIIAKKNNQERLTETVGETMRKVNVYMASNWLELNQSKTTVMVVSKSKAERDNF